MINVWESVNARAEAGDFAAVWDLGGTILLDQTGEYAARLGIRGVPCNVIVDTRGVVRTVGATTPRELEREIGALLDDG